MPKSRRNDPPKEGYRQLDIAAINDRLDKRFDLLKKMLDGKFAAMTETLVDSILRKQQETRREGHDQKVSEEVKGPTKEELCAATRALLKEVDFETVTRATPADICRQLEAQFKVDLRDREEEVKQIKDDVINSMLLDADSMLDFDIK